MEPPRTCCWEESGCGGTGGTMPYPWEGVGDALVAMPVAGLLLVMSGAPPYCDMGAAGFGGALRVFLDTCRSKHRVELPWVPV